MTTVARGGVAVAAGAGWRTARWCGDRAWAKAVPLIATIATAASKCPRINSLRLKS
jgi:hypothetical protein